MTMVSDMVVGPTPRSDRSRMAQVSALMASLALILIVLAATPAQSEAKACGEVRLSGGGVWWVGGSGLSCRKMDYWAKSMLLGKGRPKGWKCSKRGRGNKQSGGCSRGPSGKGPFFIYYPPD